MLHSTRLFNTFTHKNLHLSVRAIRVLSQAYEGWKRGKAGFARQNFLSHQTMDTSACVLLRDLRFPLFRNRGCFTRFRQLTKLPWTRDPSTASVALALDLMLPSTPSTKQGLHPSPARGSSVSFKGCTEECASGPYPANSLVSGLKGG